MPVSILYLEDNPMDVQLVQLTLAEAELDCEVTNVRNEEELRKALDPCRGSGECPYDLLLVDFTLPGYDGLAALGLVQDVCPHVPVIILSGTIGEELAVKTLQQGATDYVLKQRLYRLGPAVRRALAEAEERRERKNAEQALRLTQFSLDHCGDSVIWFDSHGRVVNVNETACRRLGYSRNELLTMQPHDFDPDYPADAWNDDWEKIKRSGTAYLESRHRAKDGRTFPVEISANFVEFEGRQYICAFARDITERKAAEQALAHALRVSDKLRAAMVSMHTCQTAREALAPLLDAAMEVCNMDMGAIYLVEGDVAVICQWHGLPDEFVRTVGRMPLAEPVVTAVADAGQPVKTGEMPGELADLAKAHGLRHAYSVPLRTEGHLFGFLNLASSRGDAPTPQSVKTLGVLALEAESLFGRFRAEEALRTSERRYRALVDKMPIVCFTFDREGRILSWNDAAEEAYGYTREEAVGANVYDLIVTPVTREATDEVIRRVFDGETVTGSEWRDRNKMGEIGWRMGNTFPLLNADGSVERGVNLNIDITDRKRAEEALRASEEKYRLLVENQTDMVVKFDVDGRLSFVSPSYCRTFGRSEDELLGEKFMPLVHEDDRRQVAKRLEDVLQPPYRAYARFRALTADGWRWQAWMNNGVLNEAGEVVEVVAVGRDITERKQAEEALRKSEEKFRGLAERSPNMIFINQGGRIVYANVRCAEVMGYTREEFCAADFDFRALIAPECRETVEAAFRRHLRGDEVEPYEYGLVTKDGRRIDAILMTRLIPYEEETAILGIAIDITDRKRAENELRHSLQTSADIVRSIPAGLCIYQYEPPDRLVLLDANPEAKRLTGVDVETCRGREFDDLWPAARQSGAVEPFLNVMRTGKTFETEDLHYKDDRLEGVYRIRAFAMPDSRLAVAFEDVLGLKRAEAALRESERQFRGLAERSFDVIFTTDLEGRITYLSPAAERVFQYRPQQMEGRHFSEILLSYEVPRALRHFAQRTRGEEVEVIQLEALRKDGQPIFIEVNSSPVMEGNAIVAVQGIIRDVTERRQAEERLRHMQAQLAHVARLSTLGELVAGIAHEVSQPLYCVVNFSKATRNVLNAGGQPDLNELREWNDEIASSAHRAGEIITRLRNFVRRKELQRARTDVNDVVRESAELVAFEARRREVALRLELSPEPIAANFDRVQVQQVLVNLLRNAFEAMESTPPEQREVAVRTAAAGQFVEVGVADQGAGLPAEDLKIFDAFATTKPDGLGMGLAISRTIVEAHGGILWATPNRPRGAAFRFTLPLT